jgi:hypothetical protein
MGCLRTDFTEICTLSQRPVGLLHNRLERWTVSPRVVWAVTTTAQYRELVELITSNRTVFYLL